MAKTTGAFFSLGASGTVGKLLTINQGATRQTARKKPGAGGPASAPQAFYRQQCADAAATWRALPQIDRDEWQAIAALSGQNVFAKYLKEWIAQHSTPATPPYIPML